MSRPAAPFWFGSVLALLAALLLVLARIDSHQHDSWLTGFAAAAASIDLVLLVAMVIARLTDRSNQRKDHAERLRHVLDAMLTGLVTIDSKERITLVNAKFATWVGQTDEILYQRTLSSLPWEFNDDAPPPWQETLTDGTPVTDEVARFTLADGTRRTFTICSTPIQGERRNKAQVLVCFDDVTDLEREKEELSEAISTVEAWRCEMRKHGDHLQRMATEDPLTGCLNRRSLFETFDRQWQLAKQNDEQLACFMLDIDLFKSVNDRHGHAMGDLVLEKVADAIRAATPSDAAICRYGGEEFCVLLPDSDIENAYQAAERVRTAVEALLLGDLQVTVSLGVSSRAFGADSPQGLIEQADRCLYAAKRLGRNQSIRWDAVPSMPTNSEPAQVTHHAGRRPTTAEEHDVEVPFHAVSALLAALEYRHRETAEHSRRVADLCVLIASDAFSVRECYILETAALLHDIGKIGIPDAILNKPAPLTREEWKTMATHINLGVEILASTFSCPLLINIIKHHHTWVAGQRCATSDTEHDAIPKGARVLAVVEAYDAMRMQTPYRKALSQDEAIDELRRCAGTQFDANVVEQLVALLEKAHRRSAPPMPITVDMTVSGRDLSEFDGVH